MADHYVTVKLGEGKVPLEKYIEFADLLLRKCQGDPEFAEVLKLGQHGEWVLEVSAQVRGFDPIVLGGYTTPGRPRVDIHLNSQDKELFQKLSK